MTQIAADRKRKTLSPQITQIAQISEIGRPTWLVDGEYRSMEYGSQGRAA
jgi:hypothetical protein